MNDIFSFSRFGRYFVADIKRAASNYGITLLYFTLGGLAIYLVGALLSLAFGGGWIHASYASRFIFFLIFEFCVVITAGAKLYGFVTDKREGSSFISLPVSTLEKTLSMIIITAFIVPCIFFCGYVSIDWLISTFDVACGDSIIDASAFLSGVSEFGDTLSGMNFWAFSLVQIIFNMIIFLLGAVCFRNHKIAKTLLFVFIATSIFSSLLSLIFAPFTPCNANTIIANFNSITTISFIVEIVVTLLLGFAVYYRVKTIKY
ncbi:MAG: hypothetical protein HUJ95_01030 [Bacteroidales bacterium]|nr:hypothetical protein [Bacteroidales bacterium]